MLCTDRESRQRKETVREVNDVVESRNLFFFLKKDREKKCRPGVRNSILRASKSHAVHRLCSHHGKSPKNFRFRQYLAQMTSNDSEGYVVWKAREIEDEATDLRVTVDFAVSTSAVR